MDYLKDVENVIEISLEVAYVMIILKISVEKPGNMKNFIHFIFDRSEEESEGKYCFRRERKEDRKHRVQT